MLREQAEPIAGRRLGAAPNDGLDTLWAQISVHINPDCLPPPRMLIGLFEGHAKGRDKPSKKAWSSLPIGQKINLLFGERPNLLTEDRDLPDEVVVLEHGHVEHGSHPREIEHGVPCVSVI
jgi:hypothetical protein